ncbi:hypothetical protein EV175_001065, partial [Coemansia sp. RSA 1933]
SDALSPRDSLSTHTFINSAFATALSDQQLQQLAKRSEQQRSWLDIDKGELLAPVLVPRQIGSTGYYATQDLISTTLSGLGYVISWDNFTTSTPVGQVPMANIIATKNPGASKRLILAAHYESKVLEGGEFIGATDSAVPVALLLDIARGLAAEIDQMTSPELTLQLIFFDGEEAYVQWTATDSLYGARHLAEFWERNPDPATSAALSTLTQQVPELERIDVMVLLDLIGASNNAFAPLQAPTANLFTELSTLERRLHGAGHISRTYMDTKYPVAAEYIADDHVPFIERNTPVLHLISRPFPTVWHTLADNAKHDNDVGSESETILSVLGMTCASCVNSIESHIGGFPGVLSVKVDLMTAQAAIRHISQAISSEGLAASINDMGFDASVVTSKVILEDTDKDKGANAAAILGTEPIDSWFSVEGMTCGACVATITDLLEGMGGVVGADVQLLTAQAKVTHVPRDIGVREIAAALSDAGYEAAPLNTNDDGNGKDTVDPSSVALKNMEKHRRQAAIRFGTSLIFAIPMFLISMIIDMALPSTNHVAMEFHRKVFKDYTVSVICIFFIATAAQFTLGLYFYNHAFKSLVRAKTANMDVLIALGTTAAYVGSIVSVTLQNGGGEQFFETAVFLMTFVLLGRWLEAIAKGRTVSAVESLVKMQPEDALLVHPKGATSGKDGEEVEAISARNIQLGDLLQVNGGMRVPCDGVVVRGQTEIDESLLTGESVPVTKAEGSIVTGGTLNLTQAIQMRATAINEASTLSRIVRLVREAQSSKPRIQEIADRVASRFVPLVVLAAVIVFIAWIIAGATGKIKSNWLVTDTNMGGFGALASHANDGAPGDQRMSYAIFSLLNAIGVLVIACPCALGLAAPTATMVGTGLAARFGILVKGGGATMEAASKIDVVAFDKTGTLTIGKPTVVDSYVSESMGAHEHGGNLVAWLNARVHELEQMSSHPLAAAICTYIRDHGLASASEKEGSGLLGHTEIPGHGMQGTVSVPGALASVLGWPSTGGDTEARLLVGKDAWIKEEGCAMSTMTDTRTQWSERGYTPVVVALVPTTGSPSLGAALAAFALADKVRPEARDVVARLKKAKISVWMISGDHPAAAHAIARQIGIDNVMAGVLPEQKSEMVRTLQLRGKQGVDGVASFGSNRGTDDLSSLESGKAVEKATAIEEPRGMGRRLLSMFCKGGRRTAPGTRQARVAMVGDGVNDAPALAQADVGIAIGSGTAAAMETAPALLMRSSLYSLLTLFSLSRVVFRRIKLNFLWASAYNVVCIPIAAGILYPAADRGLPPAVAGLLMIASSLTVMASSLSLKLYREPKY